MTKTKKTPPFCESARRWVENRLEDRSAFAPLTGQDWSAFGAFLHLVELYGRADDDGQQRALEAMAATVQAMQATTRPLCKAAIPHVLDWADEDRIWVQVLERERDRAED